MKTLYSDGFLINYEDGDTSIERNKIKHNESIFDKRHTIKDGDTLPSIAYRYYKKPNMWYLVADANNIFNPFELITGDQLVIPDINLYG